MAGRDPVILTDDAILESLGPDLLAYVRLCLDAATSLPSQDRSREYADDASYRARLRRACLADLDLWERAQRKRDRERAEAADAGLRQPEPFWVPDAVAQAIAQRAAARVADRTARDGRGSQGTNAKPGHEKVGNVQIPPAGPKR